MKKKLLSLTALMLCMVMALSSCSVFSGTVKFKNLVDKDYQPDVNASGTSLQKVDINGSFDVDVAYAETGNVIILKGENKTTKRATHTIYNVATNKIIWQGENSFTETPDGEETVNYTLQKEFVYIDGETICLIIVFKETRTVTSYAKSVCDVTVWAEDGTEVVTFDDVDKSAVQSSIWEANDLFFIHEKVYRVSKDGSVAFAFEWSNARKKPSTYLQKAGDYYVDYSSYSYEQAVCIYDNSLNTVLTYVPPMYDVIDTDLSTFDLTAHTHPLSNGNVIVQYIVGQDIMAKKYDFILLGGKYNLYTILLEPKTGNVKELKLDYLIQDVMFDDNADEMGISKEIENVAIAYPIEDGRINQNGSSAKLLSLKNDGKIVGALELPATGITVEEGITAVAHNRWLLKTVTGRSYIVDENGDILGEDFNVSERTADFFLMNNRIYDWNLDVKYDLSKEKIDTIYVMNHSVFFKTKAGAYKLFVNGEVKTIADENAVSNEKRIVKYLCNGAYMIIDSNDPAGTKYEIYNDMGVLLDTIVGGGTPEFYKKTENGAILLRTRVTSVAPEPKYYRVG